MLLFDKLQELTPTSLVASRLQGKGIFVGDEVVRRKEVKKK